MTKSEAPAFVATVRQKQIQFAKAYRVIEDAIAAHAFPGCAFGVLSEGRVVVQDAFGRFTYQDDAPAVNVETVFDIASITKVLATTAAAMLLCQRGTLDLETPLGDLLPAFVIGRLRADRARHVTIRHLLAHNSGLPGYVELFRTAVTPDALLRACFQLPLKAEPGMRAEYSDIGFILLGKALEVLIGESLDEWVEREVLGPLGLGATGFNPSPLRYLSIPPTEDDTTTRKKIIQGEVQDENAWRLRGVAGHAGLFSNVPDLLRFAKAVLAPINSGIDAGPDPLFSKSTIECFAERQEPAGSSRALGWDTPSENSSSGHHFSRRSVGHLGYSGCSLWIDLDEAIAVVLLTNRTWPDRKSQLIREVRPVFHDAVRDALDSYRKST